MRGPTWPWLITVVLIAMMGGAVWAADTGSVSGTVFDATGQPVAAVSVAITGEYLPGERTTESGVTGAYRFDFLPPGSYTLAITASGGARHQAVVEIGKDTQVDLVVGLTVSEQLVVTTVLPLVDVRSTELAFNVKADALNTLPIERTYRGMFQLIPGVADNRSVVGPAAGGNRQDNTYLVDGANITNPGFGFLSTEVNELDIAEVNLKRAGISAEFGRTGGSVTNAVSRSGSNQFEGLARVERVPSRLVADYQLPDDLLAAGIQPGAFRDPLLTADTGLAIGVGGPIVRNRAFFYGSGRYFRATKFDRFNKVGTALPDEVREGTEVFGKVSVAPAVGHQAFVTTRLRPNTISNASLNSDFAPSLASNTDNGSRIVTGEWTWFPGSRNSVDVRYLHLNESNADVPANDLGYLPAFDPNDLARMGQYNDPAQANLAVGGNQYANTQDYRRHEIRATVSHFLDGARASHALKAGGGYEFGEEEFNRLANGWGAIVAVTQSGVPALRTRYYSPQAPQLGIGRTYSFFIQDTATIGAKTTINAGVLLTRDDFAQRVAGSGGCPSTVALKGGAAVYESSGDNCTFLRFGLGDEIQPRLGISRQLRAARGDKAYANWGRYYNMDQKSSGRSLAPNRIFQTQTFFDLNGQVLSSGPLASTTGKMIDPAIRPVYTDEWLAGYATPLAGLYSLDVSFMSRSLHNIIEDVPSRMNGTAPDSGPFVAANLPCVAFAACQGAQAQRTYRAATIDLRRRLADGWMSNVSYTWSRVEGNFDLDYSQVSVFNTSSFIQDGPGTNVQDPNRFGPLAEDRPHVFKLFASYEATSRLTLSGYYRAQSGSPWTPRARDWAGAVMNYLEPAGSRRNPTWNNVDVMAAYRVSVAGANVALEARVMNVFNTQTRLTTDSQQYLDLRTIPSEPYFAPYQQANPFFGTGNAFAPPRRVYLAATASF